MNSNGQLDFIDWLSVMSFCISLLNLEENLGQSDKQDLQNDLSSKADLLLKEIHSHLEQQDALLRQILEEVKNDSK
jgi:hypothetical protein